MVLWHRATHDNQLPQDIKIELCSLDIKHLLKKTDNIRADVRVGHQGHLCNWTETGLLDLLNTSCNSPHSRLKMNSWMGSRSLKIAISVDTITLSPVKQRERWNVMNMTATLLDKILKK